MPLYEYYCEECGKQVEVIQSFSGEPPLCCGEPMHKLPTFPAKIEIKDKGRIKTHSKGYKEDYAKDYRRRLQEAKS